MLDYYRMVGYNYLDLANAEILRLENARLPKAKDRDYFLSKTSEKERF